MGQSDNIIELNGKRYDALTGKLLGKSSTPVVAASPTTNGHSGRVIDGFMRPHPKGAAPKSAQHPATAHKPVHPAPHPHTPQAKKPATRQRTGGQPIAPHKPQRAKTLMRHVVHKPDTKQKPAIKPQAPAEIMAKPASAIAHKRSAASVDPMRVLRAQHVAKSQHVRRFARDHRGTSMPVTVQHIPVKPTPPAAHRPKPVHPAPSKPTDIFEAAIAHAQSHKQLPPPGKHHRRGHSRFAGLAAGIAAFLIIGGFIAYLNMPGISINIASVRAGFHAQLPTYKPIGYALDGGVQRHDNKITLTFRSGDSSYSLTQQASDWDSQTLLDSAVAYGGEKHQTIQSNGRTIYLYDNQATWVSGGIRYDISGTNSLSTDEIAQLAASM